MKHNTLLEALGYRYIYNKKTGEVHDTKNIHQSCQFETMRNCHYISKRKAMRIIKKDKKDACRWCM